MMLVIFTYLGTDVKMSVDGTRTINKELETDPQLKEIFKLDGSRLPRKAHRHHKSYNWCNLHCAKKITQGREVRFAL